MQSRNGISCVAPGISALYQIKAGIRGQPPAERQRVRSQRSRPLVEALKLWLELKLAHLRGRSRLAEAIRYALNRWSGLSRFLDDGRIDLDTNPVERSIRPVALSKTNSLFAGSDGGARRWAVVGFLGQDCQAERGRAVCLAAGRVEQGGGRTPAAASRRVAALQSDLNRTAGHW